MSRIIFTLQRLLGILWRFLLLGDDFRLSRQPFGLALRFFGERISADVGVVFVGEVLKEGLPIPWLSVSYHFGPSRRLPAARGRR
jgi:hypothetical protein